MAYPNDYRSHLPAITPDQQALLDKLMASNANPVTKEPLDMAYGSYDSGISRNDLYSQYIAPSSFSTNGVSAQKTIQVTPNKHEILFTDGSTIIHLESLNLKTGILATKRNRIIFRALLDHLSSELYNAEEKLNNEEYKAKRKLEQAEANAAAKVSPYAAW